MHVDQRCYLLDFVFQSFQEIQQEPSKHRSRLQQHTITSTMIIRPSVITLANKGQRAKQTALNWHGWYTRSIEIPEKCHRMNPTSLPLKHRITYFNMLENIKTISLWNGTHSMTKHAKKLQLSALSEACEMQRNYVLHVLPNLCCNTAC